MELFAVQQNGVYGPGELPEGWRYDMVSVSGGLMGWTDAHDKQETLGMSPYRVGRIIAKRLPAYSYGTTLVLNMEHPVHIGQLVDADAHELEEIAGAYALRVRLVREAVRDTLDKDARVLAWCGRRAWQKEPTWDDYARWGAMMQLARYGAFEGVNGFAVGVYPIAGRGTPAWDRGPSVMRSSVRGCLALAMAAEHHTQDEYDVVVHASLETFGEGLRAPWAHPDRSLTPLEIDDVIGWAERAGVQELGFWHASRSLRDGVDATELLASYDKWRSELDEQANAAIEAQERGPADNVDLEDDAHPGG